MFAIQSYSTQLPVTNTNIKVHKYKYWKQNNTAFQAFILIQDNIQLSLYRTILSCLQERWNGQFYIVTTYPFAVLLPNFKNLQTDTHKTHSYVLSCPVSSIWPFLSWEIPTFHLVSAGNRPSIATFLLRRGCDSIQTFRAWLESFQGGSSGECRLTLGKKMKMIFLGTKGRVALPNRMNFRKNSKRPSTPRNFRKIILQFFL